MNSIHLCVFVPAAFSMTSCSVEKAPSDPPIATYWKAKASMLTVSSDVRSNGMYFDSLGGPRSILADLVECDIRRFEVNRLPNMHGEELQVIIPRDANLLIAAPCLRRNLPQGTQIQAYDWRADSLNERLEKDSLRADAAIRSYRRKKGLGPNDPINFAPSQIGETGDQGR